MPRPSKARKFAVLNPVILCVDDNATHLSLRQKVLEQNGYLVIGVTAADEALRALRERPVCAVIADHLLRGTTGVELAKKMKKLKPEVPIILFSGSNPESLDGVDVYINKGEPTPKFLSILEDVIERFWS